MSTAELARMLVAEDLAEELGRLEPDERLTCSVHRHWIHRCVSSPVHVNQITRHRWCRDCRCALVVVADEVSGNVDMACPRCGDGRSRATERLIVACRGSIALIRVAAGPGTLELAA